MFRSFVTALALGSLIASIRAQDQKPVTEAPAAQEGSPVSVPIFPNPSCPIMGKPVSTKLFAETEKGRIYVCCKSCIKDILDDVPTAYRTAYPVTKNAENKACPITGEKIEKDAPAAEIQGFDISICCEKCAPKVLESSQIVLVKLHEPKLVDLENKTCPVTGEATVRNAFAVIDGAIVRLSSPKLIEEILKDPAKVLARAREIRAKEEQERESKKPAEGQDKGKATDEEPRQD